MKLSVVFIFNQSHSCTFDISQWSTDQEVRGYVPIHTTCNLLKLFSYVVKTPRVIGHMCAATRSFYCLCIVLDRFPSTTNKLDKGLPDVATANVYKAPSIHIDIVYERNMLEMIYFSKHNARASSFLVNSLRIERIIAVEVCLICSSWQCEHVILLPTSNERSLKQTLIMSTASRVYNCI